MGLLERNVQTINDIRKCDLNTCSNTVYSDYYSKNKFCCTKCQSTFNNLNMPEESIKRAAKNRDYKKIHERRVNTLKSDIDDEGNDGYQRLSKKVQKRETMIAYLENEEKKQD